MLTKKGTTIEVPLNLSSLTAQVEAGNVIIIPATRGTYDGGTAKMVAGFGSRKERRIGADYVFFSEKHLHYADNAKHLWKRIENVEGLEFSICNRNTIARCYSRLYG